MQRSRSASKISPSCNGHIFRPICLAVTTRGPLNSSSTTSKIAATVLSLSWWRMATKPVGPPAVDCRIFIRGQLIPYLEKTWVLDESVKLWYQASNSLTAMTNNRLERFYDKQYEFAPKLTFTYISVKMVSSRLHLPDEGISQSARQSNDCSSISRR